jgi:NADH-quinone oxidoreductase subunit H
MKWALFFLGEYMHMITASAFFAAVFLGGWHLPWIDYAVYGGAQPATTGLVGVILKMAVFFAKVLLILGVMMWIRWTLPRFRFDQLMRLAWRGLIPTALLLLLATGVLAYFGQRHWMWAASIAIALLVALISPLIPAGPPVNRRVRLPGSRFSPAAD